MTNARARCALFNVTVRWGRFVEQFPTAHQTHVTIAVPGLAPVTMLLTGGLTPQAPWGDLAAQAVRLYHAGRGITEHHTDLAQLHNWLACRSNVEAFNRAWVLARDRQLRERAAALARRLAQHQAQWFTPTNTPTDRTENA